MTPSIAVPTENWSICCKTLFMFHGLCNDVLLATSVFVLHFPVLKDINIGPYFGSKHSSSYRERYFQI